MAEFTKGSGEIPPNEEGVIRASHPKNPTWQEVEIETLTCLALASIYDAGFPSYDHVHERFMFDKPNCDLYDPNLVDVP